MDVIKKNLYLFEISDVMANQVYLPYSSGVVWSYAKANPIIDNQVHLCEWFYFREKLDYYLERIKDPDILAFSCFVWNFNLSMAVAKHVKASYPDCLVVIGGQHQPLSDRIGDFFLQHPFVDIIVHGEGEESFEEILLNQLSGCSDVPAGCTTKEGSSLPRPRLADIESLPSPFTNGLFDEIVANNERGFKFHATVESARGCPFSCTFCEISTLYYNKLRTNYETTFEDVKWISDNQVEFVTDANSNYGLLPDPDMRLAEYVVEQKALTGYPEAYRVTWAKGKADKIFPIAKLFDDAGIQKGMTIALQSMHKPTLKAIKRRNVGDGKLEQFIQLYEKEKIASYVELIWGLPEETYDSFVDGVCSIMEMGYHNYIDIHLLTALPNTPFGLRSYREQYGIQTAFTKQGFFHIDDIEELSSEYSGEEEYVISTNTMSYEDWKQGHQFRWIIIAMHYLGPTQYVARYIHKAYGISYKWFYTHLLDYAAKMPSTVLGKEYLETYHGLEKVIEEKTYWGRVLPEIGTMNWDYDEATAIMVMLNSEKFYSELKEYLSRYYYGMVNRDLDTLLEYQQHRLQRPNVTYPLTVHGLRGIHRDIYRIATGIEGSIEFHGRNYNGDWKKWSREVIWYGRRNARYKTKVRL